MLLERALDQPLTGMPSQTESYSSVGVDVARSSLTALLSQVLVAFIIEFDNEFEQRTTHRTTVGSRDRGRLTGPWLTSMAGWNFMRFVDDQGVTLSELERQARAATLPVPAMLRWGYVLAGPDQTGPGPTDKRPKPPKRDWLIRPTAKGSIAREIWRPLTGIVEGRWQERFGIDAIASLRTALAAIVSQFNFELPEFLPVLGYGLFAKVDSEPKTSAADKTATVASTLSLPALLAKVLLAITFDFERQWPISLPIFLNTLRILDKSGIPQANLPRLTGVSKEAIGFTVSFLHKRGHIEVVPDATTPRTKLVRPTVKGALSKVACRQRILEVEERFWNSYGRLQVEELGASLRSLLDQKDGGQSLLGQGLVPPASGWRLRKAYIAQTLAMIHDPAGALPHYPMVLHRGGFPDGS